MTHRPIRKWNTNKMWKRIDSKSIIHFCLLYVAQILLDGPDQTLSLVGSGRIVSKFRYTDRTGPDTFAPATRSLTKSGPCQMSLHGPTDLVCDPTRPDPSVRVEIERKSLQPDKVRGLVGDPSGPWVWSGRVRVVTVVEFRNYTTRPDQRQSLVGAVWWNLDIRQHRKAWECGLCSWRCVVCESVGYNSVPCKDGWTDRDAVWGGLRWVQVTR